MAVGVSVGVFDDIVSVIVSVGEGVLVSVGEGVSVRLFV